MQVVCTAGPVLQMSSTEFHSYRQSTHLICSTHSVYIYFSSSRSCSYSSGCPPGGGCCTVCSHLAPAEVSSILSYNDGLSSVVHNTGEQNLVMQCNTHYMISECLYSYIMHAWHKRADQDLAERCVKWVLTLYTILCILYEYRSTEFLSLCVGP